MALSNESRRINPHRSATMKSLVPVAVRLPLGSLMLRGRADSGVFQSRCNLLVPFTDERLVVLLPFALEPHGRRWKAFLPQRVHGHDVITAG